MSETLFAIGTGKTRNTGIGNKARLLDQAARAGINVPAGYIVRAEALQIAHLKGYVQQDEAYNVTTNTPHALVKWLNLPTFGELVAVRSAFSEEDGESETLAGFFLTELHINPNDAHDLAGALCRVWSSAGRRRGEFRRDVIIMKMVQARHGGVAFTEREFEDDLINYTHGVADRLVKGLESGESLHLPKLRPYERRIPGTELPDWALRLQVLLRNVRRTFGAGNWDVEWVDDGKTCYLLQIRPVTRPTRRNEAFTIANHKEILPGLPSPFMTDLIASCADRLFEYYRSFDPSLPGQRPFIEVFYGRPYINLSLMTEMMRILGLPTRLVTDNVGGQSIKDYGPNLRRLFVKSIRGVLPRFAKAQLFAVRSMRRKMSRVDERIQEPGETFSELIETLRWLYSTLVTEMFSLTAAIGPMLSLLRRLGTLEEHAAHQQTISTRIYTDLKPLREYIATRPAVQQALEAGEIPDDAMFQRLWGDYLAQYGHRGIYESDISRPRFHEQPHKLFRSLLQPQRESPPPARSWKAWLTLPLWWQAGRTIRAREEWRHHVMRGFDRVRSAMLARAGELVDQGVLPACDVIWQMKLDELRRLETGWIPEPEFYEARQHKLEVMRDYDLPDLFRRFDDLEQYRARRDGPTQDAYLHGVSLTVGEVQGRAWVLEEPEVDLPEGYQPDETILVARSVDAGWIPAFALVAGVIVETGGDLSHGSIILRELGLPAVTNVYGVTDSVEPGEPLVLHAGRGLVERPQKAGRLQTATSPEAAQHDEPSAPDMPDADADVIGAEVP